MRSWEHSASIRLESRSSGYNCPKVSPAQGRFCVVRRRIGWKSLSDVAYWRPVGLKQTGRIADPGHMGNVGYIG